MPITRFDASQHSARIAGEVKGFDPLQFVDKKDVKKMDVFIQFALAAAQFAVDDARLHGDAGDRRSASASSSRRASAASRRSRTSTRQLIKGGPRRISPFFIPASIINLAAGQVSIRFNARGPNLATCTACTASAHAIGEAFEIIRRGDADVMIAGGSEAAITPMGVGGFAAMRALSTRNDEPDKASRPFDKDRDGFVMGEGAGIVILEELRGRARGAARAIYAEIVGYGLTSDALPPHRPARGRARRDPLDDDGAAQGAASSRSRSTTSTPTARRRRSTIRPRRSASRRCSAITPTSWRCRRRSR